MSTRTPTTPTPPAETEQPSHSWRDKSFDYDRALSLLADDLLALARGDVRRPAPTSPPVAHASVEEENAS